MSVYVGRRSIPSSASRRYKVERLMLNISDILHSQELGQDTEMMSHLYQFV